MGSGFFPLVFSVQAGVDVDHDRDFQQSGKDARMLGDDVFVAQACAKSGLSCTSLPDLCDVIDYITKKYELKESDLMLKTRGHQAAEARAVIAWIAKEMGSATLTQVAHRFHRDVATISGGVSRICKRSLVDEVFQVRLSLLRSRFDSSLS